MEQTAIEIFDAVAKEQMIIWDLDNFKRDYPKLFNTIMLSMEIYKKDAEQVIHEKWYERMSLLNYKLTGEKIK